MYLHLQVVYLDHGFHYVAPEWGLESFECGGWRALNVGAAGL